MKHQQSCCTITANKPFITVLADWLLSEYSSDAQKLSKVLVLLPNRRACRSLRDAFLERSTGTPLLLPQIQPIGDNHEEFTAAHFTKGRLDILPAIAPLCRELLLTQLVHRFSNPYKDHVSGQSAGYNLEQSARLARQLARFLDEINRQALSLDHLAELVDDDNLALHWQQTLSFLSIISQQWPQILKEEGVQDVVTHRNQLLQATIELWNETPSDTPIIAAGIVSEQPLILSLLKSISNMPEGRIVLPYLDKDMPDEQWDQLIETHPQYAFKQTLSSLSLKREDVRVIDEKNISQHDIDQTECLRTIFHPPASTKQWSSLTLPLAQSLSHIQLLTADTHFDEARMIAIALRKALETPGKTAALVTPDRNLARMVAAQLQRFHIMIDDSAGAPLKNTTPACFMRLVVDVITSAAAPAPLLAMLRHPLTAAGLTPSDCRKLSRELELKQLRGIRLTPGLKSLNQNEDLSKALQHILTQLHDKSKAFSALFDSKKPVSFHQMLSSHIALCEWLASTADTAGTERLWATEAGNTLAAFLAELLEHADRLDAIEPDSYASLLETLLGEQAFRPQHGLHPRLHILGPMEARLQHFDLMILASLNEGTWPGSPEADPWMSRPMRQKFGLMPPEYHIGTSAHDLFQFCCAPEVILSRSEKIEGTPTVPSRWLVRLYTLIEGLDKPLLTDMQREQHWLTQASLFLDAADDIPTLTAPTPVPPLDARPRKLGVTAIDNWIRDPYMIYARYILGLRKLSPLDEEPDGAEFGTLVHSALEQFTKRFPDTLPDNALDVLLSCGRDAFSSLINRPAVACLWWPRFENIAHWVIKEEHVRRANGVTIIAEYKAHLEQNINGNNFTLTTSIDRIEIRPDGSLSIVDYKTGAIPNKTELTHGKANQLPLEALILQHQTHHERLAGSITEMEYWKLGSNIDNCEITSLSSLPKKTIEDYINQSEEIMHALVKRFDNASEPYTAQQNPSLRARYNDYEHLTRYKEWEAG